MKKISLIFLFLAACTSQPKLPEPTDVVLVDKKPAKTIELDQEPLNPILGTVGYASSLSLTGASYTVDGVIYLTGGTVATAIHCFPLALMLLASSRSSNGYVTPFCLGMNGFAYNFLERNHPHLGEKVWQATSHWRGPLKVL